MPKIARSYAIEALDEQPDATRPSNIARGVLLDVLGEAETASFATFDDGFDVRIVGRSLTGAALIFGSRIVHVAAFTDQWPRKLRTCDIPRHRGRPHAGCQMGSAAQSSYDRVCD